MRSEIRIWEIIADWSWCVSILILQGCALKLINDLDKAHREQKFQSSFYKDALWNTKRSGRSMLKISGFNPHFTRMRSEITFQHSIEPLPKIVSILILQGCALKSGHNNPNNFYQSLFQSSFYKDALWNFLYVQVRDLVIGFNPHFTRMRSEINLKTA